MLRVDACLRFDGDCWGAVFGQLTDRFGTDWMLNFQEQAGQRGEAPGRAYQV